MTAKSFSVTQLRALRFIARNLQTHAATVMLCAEWKEPLWLGFPFRHRTLSILNQRGFIAAGGIMLPLHYRFSFHYIALTAKGEQAVQEIKK